MNIKAYNIPLTVVDERENASLETLTAQYNKLVEPSAISKAIEKLDEKVPEAVKDFFDTTKEKITDAQLVMKCLGVLGEGFQKLEEFASKITVSEKEVLSAVNAIVPDNEITSLEEICLARSYDLSKLVNRSKYLDITAAFVEGAATGAPGFIGLPFNLVLSTFLFYRAVQSIALFYGYDIKNDPAELQIASQVFAGAVNPRGSNGEFSNAIAKIMLISTTTAVQQTAKRGWNAMAQSGGARLLLTQIRALANAAAKKALEKAGKEGLEKSIFAGLLAQIGKNLTQKTIAKSIPYVGAIIGATMDTAQMIKILDFSNMFYLKRFILEKEERVARLTVK